MQWIASGVYTGQPSGNLVFSNVLIGWTIRGLYGLWGGCNWYFIYLLTVHYCSLTVIAFLALRRRSHWSFVLLYAGFFLVVESRVLLELQFTTTAFVAGTAGMLLLVDGLQPGKPVRWLEVIAGGLFTALMGMIREPVAPLLALMALPFLLERFGLNAWRRLLTAGLVCVALFLALHGVNRWNYQRDPAWAEFLEYNRINGWIRARAMKTSIPQAAPAVGWSENDAWIFDRWYFFDPEVYGSLSKMRRLLDELQNIPRSHPYAGRYALFCFQLPKVLGSDAGALLKLALLNAALCLFFAGTQRMRCFVGLVGIYGMFVLLAFCLLNRAYLPQRVAYTMPLFMHAVCLYWASGFWSAPRRSWMVQASFFGSRLATFLRFGVLALIPLWAILYAVLLVAWTRDLWIMNGATVYLKNEVSPKIFDPLRSLLPAGKKPVIIPVSFNTPSQLEDCLFFHAAEDLPFTLLPYGWLIQSPLFHQTLNQHRLNPYSVSLVDRPDVFFSMGPTWVQPLRACLKTH